MRFLLISLSILALSMTSGVAAQDTLSPPSALGPRRSLAWSGAPADRARPVQEKIRVDASRPASAPLLVAVGALSGVAGFFGGAVAGAMIEESWAPCNCDDPGLHGLFLGAAIGPAITIPVAVHLTNRGRGSFFATLGSSVAAGAAGFALTASRGDGSAFIVAPIAELVTAVIVERALSH